MYDEHTAITLNMKIAVGSTRESKLSAVRSGLARIAEVVPGWSDAEIVGRAIEFDAPPMPLSDEQLIDGARARAFAVQASLAAESSFADYCVGMEGGFHTLSIQNIQHTFLRGWVCVADGEREFFGSTGSISVPTWLARRVIDERRELGAVIDEVTREKDVRSRQGTWGVLSLDLITRSASFETAVIAAFAPFYNVGFRLHKSA